MDSHLSSMMVLLQHSKSGLRYIFLIGFWLSIIKVVFEVRAFNRTRRLMLSLFNDLSLPLMCNTQAGVFTRHVRSFCASLPHFTKMWHDRLDLVFYFAAFCDVCVAWALNLWLVASPWSHRLCHINHGLVCANIMLGLCIEGFPVTCRPIGTLITSSVGAFRAIGLSWKVFQRKGWVLELAFACCFCQIWNTLGESLSLAFFFFFFVAWSNAFWHFSAQ